MEPGGSMPHSQGLSNNSYPDFKSELGLEWGLPNLVRITGQQLDLEIADPIKKVDINRLNGAYC